MRKWSYPLLCLLLAGWLGSCMRPEDFDSDMLANVVLDYDIALPLTETRLTIENLIDLKGGNFVPDDTSLLHIIYTMEPAKARLIDEIKLGETSAFGFSSDQLTYTCLKDTVFSIPFSERVFFDMSGTDARIETIYLSSASIAMMLRNSFLFPMDLSMDFENIRDENGQKVSYSAQIPAQTSCDTTVTFSNIRVELNQEKTPYFDVSGIARIMVKRMAGDTVLHTASVYSSSVFRDMEFRRAEGHLNRTPYTVKGKMSIAGMGLDRMKNINFNEAYMIADLKVAGLSAPLRLTRTDVRILNAGTPTVLPLFPENYDVEYPGLHDEPLEKKSQTSMEMVDVLIDNPYGVEYTLDGFLNPDNDTSTLQAMEQDGNFSVVLTCDIPVYFSADRYSLRDTLELNLDELTEDTELRYFDIKSIAKNAFPLDAAFSIHFLDAGYNELFTLFHEDSISGGKIGPPPGYHVVEPTVSRFEDCLDQEELQRVRSLRYIVVDAAFSTTDKATVKFYVDGEKEGYLDIKVGVRIKIKQSALLERMKDGE